VFVAGESLRGPGMAIEAVADGHRVAEVVARFLETGQVAAPVEEESSPLEPFPDDVLTRLRQLRPAAVEPEPFAQGEPMLDEAAAQREAGRCLGCLAGGVIDESKCAACLTCFRVCPLDAIEIGEAMHANPARCQACGVCASLCPANAITLSYWQADEEEQRKPLVEPIASPGTQASTLAVQCRHKADGDIQASHLVRVPCLARLKPIDLLELFRQGYRTVTLYPCAEDECKYGAAWANIDSLVSYVRSVLEEALPAARIEVCVPQPAGEAT
jgi:ferredoxin